MYPLSWLYRYAQPYHQYGYSNFSSSFQMQRYIIAEDRFWTRYQIQESFEDSVNVNLNYIKNPEIHIIKQDLPTFKLTSKSVTSSFRQAHFLSGTWWRPLVKPQSPAPRPSLGPSPPWIIPVCSKCPTTLPSCHPPTHLCSTSPLVHRRGVVMALPASASQRQRSTWTSSSSTQVWTYWKKRSGPMAECEFNKLFHI